MASLTSTNPLGALPDEILQAIFYHLPPDALESLQLTSKRLKTVADEPLLWRFHCQTHYESWQSKEEMQAKYAAPATETNWKQLFQARRKTDRFIARRLDRIIASEQNRMRNIWSITQFKADAKDELLRQARSQETHPEDHLARTWWSEEVLAQIHRRMAIEIWQNMAMSEGSSETGYGLSLESALGAFDVFVLGSRRGDLDDIRAALDELASSFKLQNPDFGELSTRNRMLRLIQFMRDRGFTGIAEPGSYHEMQNNFMGHALLDKRHQTLPLTLTCIYICLGKRLGLDVRASNTPMHMYGMVFAKPGLTLDDKPLDPGTPAQSMFIDPFRHANEVPIADIRRYLRDVGITTDDAMKQNMEVASTRDILQRTTRNIMQSAQFVQEIEQDERESGGDGTSWLSRTPKTSDAFYAALWAMLMLQSASTLARGPHQMAAQYATRRARLMPWLLDKVQPSYPWDVGFLEEFVVPTFASVDSSGPLETQPWLLGQLADRDQLVHVINEIRNAESIRKPPKRRPETGPVASVEQAESSGGTGGASAGSRAAAGGGAGQAGLEKVRFRVGSVIKHHRYGYEGVIVGWDTRCRKDETWMRQMGVNALACGREQSFYNVLSADTSLRYVAEENIGLARAEPSRALFTLAGRYFRRWEGGRFVSNIRDEYPDD